jgi:2'-5' RNA ligase
VRLFVAVWPDAETLERLAALTLELGRPDGLRVVSSAEWHVTLRFLGQVEEVAVPRLTEALASVGRAGSGPVRCELGPATAWFSGGRVLQLPATGLDDLAACVRKMTRPVIPEDRPKRFTGHLTLARAKGRGLPATAREQLAGLPFSARFEVAHLDLVSSESTSEGPRYVTLARASLEGR